MEIPELIPENIYPVGPRILLEVWKQASETSAGLAMAEGDGHATPTVGRVVRTGNGEASPFKVGDFLMWRRYGVDSIKVNTADGDVEFYLLEEEEVIARVRGPVEAAQKQGDYSQITEKTNVSTQETARIKEESPGKGD